MDYAKSSGDDKPTPQALVEKFETYREKGGENAATSTPNNATTTTSTQPTSGTKDKGTGASSLAPPKSTVPTQASTSSASSGRVHARVRAHEQEQEREREREHRHRHRHRHHGRKRPRENLFSKPPPMRRVRLEDIHKYTLLGWRTDCQGYACGRWHCMDCWDADDIEGESHRSTRTVMKLENPERCDRTYTINDCGGGECDEPSCWSCVGMLYATRELIQGLGIPAASGALGRF